MMTNREKLKGMGLLEMFLKNSKTSDPVAEYTNLSGALSQAFTWSRSPEGHDFWSYICKCLTDSELEERK